MRDLFGDSMAIFASLVGPHHVVEAANPTFFAVLGCLAPRLGAPVAELVDPQYVANLSALLDQVYLTGEATLGRDAPVVLGLGADARPAFFDFTCEARRDTGGQIVGVAVVGVETTQVKHAQHLMAEHRALLEQIARQAPLADVLDGMARCIEELAPHDVLVSVLLADDDGSHLHHGAAPSLPDFYNEAIDGIATGEGVGSCGTAAYRRETVIVTDIATDPFWADFRGLAEQAGVAACWSTPILARDGRLLGTFAMYHRTPRVPQAADLALARVFADTAALALDRHQVEQAKAAAEAEARAAHDALAAAVAAEQQLRSEAEARATAAAELAEAMRTAAATQAEAPHPQHCQLGGRSGCTTAAEVKLADSWGDSAWGCLTHVEEAMLNVRSVFIANEEFGGLGAYVNR
ncbi:GAF domain-containing protein [Cellulomonas sp. URHB0016]